MAKIISVANQKGGVGKTTVTFNLGWALAKQGARVLLIDNDPQGNLTSYAWVGGLKKSGLPSGILTMDEVYVARRLPPIERSQLAHLAGELYMLPADAMLAGVDYYLMARSDKELILKDSLKTLEGQFDYMLIDNPPSLNLLTVNALVASDEVLLPVQLEYFSLEGVVLLRQTLESLAAKNPRLKLRGIVANRVDERRNLHLEVLDLLKKEFGDSVLKTVLHETVKVAESSGFSKSIMDYAPSSRGAKEFMQLGEEIISGIKKDKPKTRNQSV